MCWMEPAPLISARVTVFSGGITMNGFTFQPCPRSRAAFEALPSVAMPPLPFSPLKFSGLIEKLLALETRYRLLRLLVSPSYELSWATPVNGSRSSSPTIQYSDFIRGNSPSGLKCDPLDLTIYFSWPRGAAIDCVGHFDNSLNDLSNPDLKPDVNYGDKPRRRVNSFVEVGDRSWNRDP